MAAGLGYIELATGDVLTASIANGYLASQTVMVFADATARTSAIASPQEGMISYLKDTNATEYYSGSAWVAIGGASGGMTSIASGSLSGSALSLTSISGSYKSLQLVLRNATPSAATDWRFKINNNSSAIYGRILMLSPGSSTFTSAAGVNQTDVAANYNSPTTSSGTTLIMNFPDYANTTSKKMIDWLMTYEKNGSSDEETLLGVVSANDNNAITRFDLSLFSGTFSAGTYILYGVN